MRMIIDTLNPGKVILQVLPQNLDGTPKEVLTSAKVRVYHVESSLEVEDLSLQNLSKYSGTYSWRYIWEPVSLPIDHYFAEYTLVDEENVTAVFIEDIIILERNPTVVEIDEELTENHGSGSWTTNPHGGNPKVIPG